MKYVLSTSARLACPNCGSPNLARSHRKGIYERVLNSIFQVRPYRCMSCDDRHYRYRPSSSHGHEALPSAPK